ncbi:unnamed protein product [Lathyrus sativus]|nr:unnamed protein product [Lathyrus sativus]
MAWGDYCLCIQISEVIRLPKSVSIPVTLKVLEFELFHFYPIPKIMCGISFAAVGLMDMFNTGGALDEVEIHRETDKKQELFDREVVSSELIISLGPN